MVDFTWTREQLQLRAQAFALGGSLNEQVVADDRDARFPREKWDRLADAGLLGLCVPADLGGAELDLMTGLLIYEGLGEGWEDTGLLFSACVQAWVVLPAFLKFAQDEARKRYIPRLADGSAIGAFAITEPNSGSDTFAMSTRAVRSDGGWRLSGHKSYISLAPVADILVCFARTSEAHGPLAGITAFVVDASAPGVSRTRSTEKMGLRTAPLGDVYLDDVAVADGNVLGRVGLGAAVFNESMESERIWPMAAQVGLLGRELEKACAHARDRRSFGSPISAHQSVSNRLVDMRTRLEAGRLLLYRAAWLKAQGRSARFESAMVKYWIGECALANTLDGLQVHGAYGYMTEAGLERQVRDAVGSRIYSGTSDLCRLVVARGMGL